MAQQSEVRRFLEEWSDDLELLRQNRLLKEAEFIKFAKDRGIDVFGINSGDPGNFYQRGWLPTDGTDAKGGPLFHPFRVYTVHKILEACKLRVAPSASLQRDSIMALLEQAVAWLPTADDMEPAILQSTEATDLAVVLEPIYWSRLTNRISRHMTFRNIRITDSEYDARLDQYRGKVLDLVKTLDPNLWRGIHESLRLDAAQIDENSDLYIILRLARWKQREKLKGPISGTLWVRHIAELIRRAFEEVHNQCWPEEDQAFRKWVSGGRKIVFGSERPLDNEVTSRPYLASEYGLFTGSAVRWYVEGETEYYAILQILSDPSNLGIECVNLRGNVASERDNIALKLRDMLLEDKALKRFSIISFDTDVAPNVKAIRRQIKNGNVVGLIFPHKPDFEFANFTIQELIDIAARLDEAHDYPGDLVRNADWTGVGDARAFELRYKAVSGRSPPGLKGEEWGRALGAHAAEHSNRGNDGSERALWLEIGAAARSRFSHYDYQAEHFGFNSDTFQQIEIRPQNKRS